MEKTRGRDCHRVIFFSYEQYIYIALRVVNYHWTCKGLNTVVHAYSGGW